MMENRYQDQIRFQYPHMVMANVTGVHGVSALRKLLIDVTALDGRGSWQQLPVSCGPGVTRNYRVGQVVGLLFRYGASNLPTVVGHIHNLETDAKYTNPLAPPFEYVDDQVHYHPETGAFLRFRSATSNAKAGGGDKQPAIVETTLASGASLIITETDATHAKALLTLPSGASVAIDVDGIVTVTSPKKVVVVAPDVELGDDTSKAQGNAVVRQSDLADVVDLFNAHVHDGVLSGPDVSGVPADPITTPVCSAVVFSE